jgi:hypothetical protein
MTASLRFGFCHLQAAANQTCSLSLASDRGPGYTQHASCHRHSVIIATTGRRLRRVASFKQLPPAQASAANCCHLC